MGMTLKRRSIKSVGSSNALTRAGEKIAPSAITATVDGLTTGLITDSMGFVVVTSGNAAHIITLPAAVPGITIEGWISTTGVVMRTPAASNVKINNVDADGTNSLTIAVGETFRAICVATTEWKVQRWTIAGAAAAAVPA